MKRIPVRENGLAGTLFIEGNPHSGVIVLGGSSGGLNESRAEKLAQEGFATLALAYFAFEHLPATLKEIPLEYFEKAIQFFSQHVKNIGIWGVSRGAELSLVLGTVFSDQIDAIAAHVPSSVIYGALDQLGPPAWIYRGKSLAPNAPFVYVQNATGETEQSAIAPTLSFLSGMENEQAFAAAAIPVEKLQCPLLLISAQDDQMWPSALYAEQIVNRLQKHQSPIFHRHLSYPGVGHSPAKGISGLHPIMKRWFAYGGNPKDNALAAEEWWKETLSFFRQRLV